MSDYHDSKDQAFVWKVKNGELTDIKKFVEEEISRVFLTAHNSGIMKLLTKGNIYLGNKDDEQGVDVNKEVQGRLPLHYAADYGQEEVLLYLLSKGANINAPDKYGITPLLSAIFEGHTAIVKLLLERGADKSGKSPDGANYIDCAEKDEIKALLK